MSTETGSQCDLLWIFVVTYEPFTIALKWFTLSLCDLPFHRPWHCSLHPELILASLRGNICALIIHLSYRIYKYCSIKYTCNIYTLCHIVVIKISLCNVFGISKYIVRYKVIQKIVIFLRELCCEVPTWWQ